jgi:hypothetical protein
MQCNVGQLQQLTVLCVKGMLLYAGDMCARGEVSLHSPCACCAGNQGPVPLVASVWCCVQATRVVIGMLGGCGAGSAGLSSSAVVVLCRERSLRLVIVCLLAVLVVVWCGLCRAVSMAAAGSVVRVRSADALLGLLRFWACICQQLVHPCCVAFRKRGL